MRLILFSGGVESTALLTIAEKQDILLLSDLPFKNYQTGYDRAKCEQIADYFGNRIVFYECSMPDDGNKWQHQIHWLMTAAHLYVNSRDDITEVWHGRSQDENRKMSSHKVDTYSKHEEAWRILNPKIKLFKPLEFLSKKQQWNLIPDDVKPLVNSCIYNNKCGTCSKCKEFKLGVNNEEHV
jgi:7-cyano-7-deazaguanine synthase in queuosine biosynthesis